MSTPSKKGYVVGGALIAVGVIGAVVWFAAGFMSFSDTIDEFQRVPINGRGEVTFEGTGGYVLYYEGPGAGDGEVPAGRAELSPVGGGDALPLDTYDSELTYDLGGHSGAAVLTVEIEEPGTYVLASESEGDGDGELAVGRSVARRLVTAIVGGLIIGVLGVVAGLVVLIVTAVRRRGTRHVNAPWIPPPPGSPTPPPPP